MASESALISFVPPVDDGGTPITGYTVTSTPGNITASGTSSPINVTGLTNGVSYTFTVHANNINGAGPESDPSNAVIPAVPDTFSGILFNMPISVDGGVGTTFYTERIAQMPISVDPGPVTTFYTNLIAQMPISVAPGTGTTFYTNLIAQMPITVS